MAVEEGKDCLGVAITITHQVNTLKKVTRVAFRSFEVRVHSLFSDETRCNHVNLWPTLSVQGQVSIFRYTWAAKEPRPQSSGSKIFTINTA